VSPGSGCSVKDRKGTVAMVRGIRVPSGGVVVMMGVDGVTTLHSREMGKTELLPPLEVVTLIGRDLENSMCT
jgi:hypothetical protein